MTERGRNRTIIIIVVVTLALVTALSGVAAWNGSRATDATKDIAKTLAKRSPITQFDAAVAFHNDCRKDLEDSYFGAIGHAVDPAADETVRKASAAQAAAAGAKLADIESVCPAPLPAVIDPGGTVMAPPVIPEQYLCRMERRPCNAPPPR